MADVVHYRLEHMTNELDDLEWRRLFTRREIAEIVKWRRKFEYQLKRPSPLKQDYIAYIDYESRLDDLRRLRKKAAASELAREGKKKIKMKNSISDYAVVTRIVQIYGLAVMRYKGDIELWFRYLEFLACLDTEKVLELMEKWSSAFKSSSVIAISTVIIISELALNWDVTTIHQLFFMFNVLTYQVLAQVIRFHPKVPGVWIYAVGSEDLWIEYLRMELTYLNKLKASKVALGVDKGNSSSRLKEYC
ncbi:hypothetical protein SLEP1_g26702 [Rubroshorea leprosula]|uniref:U3 small nucleolar RNA-associated protein 6 N-terminal domain-containing protein n=1 Tax=Rubroshorea leprosula TaxID=152421 RepID=A0AAV5JX87_9ROSI|nr:hypothetical protein SLEP1_g26702 [Rubroshorea leprosula]